jgi:cation diffusion facilitator CzcD-associated flavoprotein CzcO
MAGSGESETTKRMPNTDFDVIVVGAGISGINFAYRLQTQLPGYTYTILEARNAIGGTWDLFRYPGIRSDSDLHTFGFSWRAWTDQIPIADGPSILKYMKETAAMYGIDRKIQFHRKLVSANWSSQEQMWTLTAEEVGGGEKEEFHFRARFLVFGTGYYDYKEPLPAGIPGIKNFKGPVLHPQFWPENFDYTGKRIVVIGSGATAITLIPKLAEKAAQLTMLQRSPSYVLSIPNQLNRSWARILLPCWLAFKIDRLKFLLVTFLLYKLSKAYPNVVRRLLNFAARRQLPATVPQNPHFEPAYDPWQQRLCVCPDGDFFKSFHKGNTNIVTSRIRSVTETGIHLESGETLDADIIVTATGLKLQVAGGSHILVDNNLINLAEKFFWNGIMLQDVPNCTFVTGYAHLSWTLGADATALLFCRLLRYMHRRGLVSVVPRLENRAAATMSTRPLLDLSSTYINAAKDLLPKAGDKGPWRPRVNYFADYIHARFGNLSSGLEFTRQSGVLD